MSRTGFSLSAVQEGPKPAPYAECFVWATQHWSGASNTDGRIQTVGTDFGEEHLRGRTQGGIQATALQVPIQTTKCDIPRRNVARPRLSDAATTPTLPKPRLCSLRDEATSCTCESKVKQQQTEELQARGSGRGAMQVLKSGYTACVKANEDWRPASNLECKRKVLSAQRYRAGVEACLSGLGGAGTRLTHGDFVTKGSDACTGGRGGSWRLPRACYRAAKRWASLRLGSGPISPYQHHRLLLSKSPHHFRHAHPDRAPFARLGPFSPGIPDSRNLATSPFRPTCEELCFRGRRGACQSDTKTFSYQCQGGQVHNWG